MLTKGRQKIILRVLQERGSVTVSELTALLDSSESTIRRDLHAMDSEGLLNKVHGGATAIESAPFSTRESTIGLKRTQQLAEKQAIGKLAAGLVGREDFVFVDSGSTTEALAAAIADPAALAAIYVTNGLIQAELLLRKGCTVYVLEGRLRAETEAIVGSGTMLSLEKYQFTMGFFGTNGIDLERGYTTPDVEESQIKTSAFARCEKPFVLADASKFNQITPVTFGDLAGATIVTDRLPDARYGRYTTIMEANK